jgi:predicted trehalose synthase
LLERVSSGTETAQRVRLVQSLLSHASIVYDDRLFMKAYRVLERAPRPEVDLVRRLDAVGFMHMSKPVAYWERNGWDLALVREYIPGSVEGRLLALTSLRDLLGRNVNEPHASLEEVARAGGDLSSEMRRLGEITADFHLALAEAFGVRRTSGAPRVSD